MLKLTIAFVAVVLLGGIGLSWLGFGVRPPLGDPESSSSSSSEGRVPAPLSNVRSPAEGLPPTREEDSHVYSREEVYPREEGDQASSVKGSTQSDQSQVDPAVKDRVDAARSLGILKSSFDLKNPGAWGEFARIWDETTAIVRSTHNERIGIGRRIAAARFKEGKCDTILFEESDRQKDGGFGGVWQNLGHPDEFLSTNYDYRPGGGQKITQVRIPPGENGDMDNATLCLKLAQDMRRDAMLTLVKH